MVSRLDCSYAKIVYEHLEGRITPLVTSSNSRHKLIAISAKMVSSLTSSEGCMMNNSVSSTKAMRAKVMTRPDSDDMN